MLGAIAEFERDLINERVREGIEAAKKKGVQFVDELFWVLKRRILYISSMKKGSLLHGYLSFFM